MSLRRIISQITAWWVSRRVARNLPELVEIRREIDERRRKHQPVRRLLRAQREIIRNQLARLGIRNPVKIQSAGFVQFKRQARASTPLPEHKKLPPRRLKI